MDRASEPTTSSRSAPDKLHALTGLRFLAALLVVFFHYLRPALTSAPKWADSVAEQGHTAVVLFFLLSGFVLSHRYIDASGRFRGTIGRYLTARLARIYPVYLFAFLLSAPFVISACLRVNTLGTGVLKLSVVGLMSLGLQQSWTPWTAWYWNAPAWSISVEAFFYLSFPLLAPLVWRMSKRMLIGAMFAVWIVPLLVPLAFSLTRYGAATMPPIPLLRVLFDPGMLFRLPEFMAGVLVGRYFSLDKEQQITRGPALAVIGFLGWLVLLAFGSSIPRFYYFAGLPIPLFAMLVLGLAHGRGWLAAWLRTPALVLLGEASYGVYILQWPMANIFGIPSGARSFAEFALFGGALIMLAILSMKYLESPARVAIMRRYDEGRKCVTAVPAHIPEAVLSLRELS